MGSEDDESDEMEDEVHPDLGAALEGVDEEEMEDERLPAVAPADLAAALEGADEEEMEDERLSDWRHLNRFSAAIDRCPNDARLRCCRASIYLELEDWCSAEEDATVALNLRPSYVKSLLIRSTARFEQENAQGALDDAEAGLALDATNNELLSMKDKAVKALNAPTPEEKELYNTFKNAQVHLATVKGHLKNGNCCNWPGGIGDLHSRILRHNEEIQLAHDALVEINPLWAEHLRIPKAGRKIPKDKIPARNEIHRVFQSYCDRVEDAVAGSSLPQKDRAKQLLLEDWDRFNPKSM